MPNPNRLSELDLTRRRFLRDSILAGAATLGFPAIVASRSPGSILNIALIGVGGRGASNAEKMAAENVVAICDVNKTYLDKAAQKFPKARTYRDFRKLYEAERGIDAVVVSTTEHTHALATLPALKMRKHVFCEKPLTHDVREARIIMEAAKKAGVATQMGTQIHAGENYRRVVELIQAGAIGPVSEVHVWVARAWGWQSKEDAKANGGIVSVRERPKESMPPPADVDWLFSNPSNRHPWGARKVLMRLPLLHSRFKCTARKRARMQRIAPAHFVGWAIPTPF